MSRAERIVPHSKQSFSVMFCGNAEGRYIQPMVVYKALNIYTNWTANGPKGKGSILTKKYIAGHVHFAYSNIRNLLEFKLCVKLIKL